MKTVVIGGGGWSWGGIIWGVGSLGGSLGGGGDHNEEM